MHERRDFIVIILGRGLQVVTAFASTRLLTSFLSPEEVGRCSILAGLTAFFALLLINPMGTYINRKTHEWHRNGTIQSNLYLYWLYLLAIALFALIVLLLLKSTVGLGIEIAWFWLLVVVAGSLLFNTGNVTITSILNMLGNRIAFVVLTLLTLWLGLGLSVLFVTQIAGRAEYWLSGGILSLLVIFGGAYGYLTRGLNHTKNGACSESLSIPQWGMLLPVLRFAWPVAITAGLSWVQMQSYRFVLSHFGGLGALGLFTVGYGIGASLLGIFFAIFMQYYYPIFYREVSTADSEGRRTSWNKLAVYLFPGALLMAAFTIACAPYLTKLMVAAEFQASEQFILWGALTYFAYVVCCGFGMIAHAEMKTIWLIRPGITGAVLALGGVLLLARWNPQVGTGIALTTAGFAMAVHLAIKLHKEVAFSFPWRRIFISIALSAPLLVGLVGGVNKLYGTPTYIQSLIILLIAGIYLLIAQYLMTTRWLGKIKTKEEA
jgi:O-antigen/teichoic acid export membrane protein